MPTSHAPANCCPSCGLKVQRMRRSRRNRLDGVADPAGVYNLEVSTSGFSKMVQQGIHVQVAVIARIDVKLQLSSTK